MSEFKRDSLAVTVVVPTRNRAGLLHDALVSMQRQTWPSENYEIIVVDNGSNDDTSAVVQGLTQDSRVRIRYVHEPRVGLCHARHAGAAHARSEVVLFGEDDVLAFPDWVERMAICFKSSPSLAAVGGKIMPQWVDEPPDWLFQFGTRTNLGLLGLLDLGDGFFILSASQCAYGGNLAIRRSVLYRVGGFNPDGLPEDQLIYRGDGEIGLQKKLRAMGYEIAYNGKAAVRHVIDRRRMTAEYLLARSHREGYSRAYARYRDHGGALTPMLIGTGISAMRWLAYRLARRVVCRGHGNLRREFLISALGSDVRHALRILRRKELQEFVLRRDYFEDDLLTSV